MTTIDLDRDPWIRWAGIVLWFSGVMYLLLGIGFPLFFVAMGLAAGGDSDMIEGIVFGVMIFVISIACAVGNFIVAVGLGRRAKWSWVAGVAVGAIYAPSGCLPLGAVLLYALLRPGVQDAFKSYRRA